MTGRLDANSHPLINCHCCLFQEDTPVYSTLTLHIKDMMNLETARFAAPASTVDSEDLVLTQKDSHFSR